MIVIVFEDVYLFVNMIEGGKIFVLFCDELVEIGFKIVVYFLLGLFFVIKVMINCYC